MSIKVEVKEKHADDEYPKLMISTIDGIIILATKCHDERYWGLVLHEGDSNSYAGEWSYSWNARVFYELPGSITLSNE